MSIFEILSVVSICLNMFLLGQAYKHNTAIKKIVKIFVHVQEALEYERQKQQIKKLNGEENEE